MKKLITILLLGFTITAFSQMQFGSELDYDCEMTEKISEWRFYDTIGVYKDTLNEWVNSKWKPVNPSNGVFAVYCPYGCSYSEYQFRICKNTGIRQRRIRSTSFSMKMKPLSEYQKTINHLKGGK